MHQALVLVLVHLLLHQQGSLMVQPFTISTVSIFLAILEAAQLSENSRYQC